MTDLQHTSGHLKTPEDCTALSDIRTALDLIDREVIALLGLRDRYVARAADFKPDMTSIPAPDRVVEMLHDRRRWAEDAGLDPAFIAPLYAQIIQWFIDRQTRVWTNKYGDKRRRSAPGGA